MNPARKGTDQFFLYQAENAPLWEPETPVLRFYGGFSPLGFQCSTQRVVWSALGECPSRDSFRRWVLRESRVSPQEMVLVGSLALSLDTPGSDVDLVCRGCSATESEGTSRTGADLYKLFFSRSRRCHDGPVWGVHGPMWRAPSSLLSSFLEQWSKSFDPSQP